ncbi:MAG TPA: biotin--[acetyl-CoA-carboxylase] ligase [Polyangiales bacterium]|nr:biotin--[acetyl-CoA-carboxylase] ligase [Polyangiales bacterium]
MSSDLEQERIAALLTTSRLGRAMKIELETGSTNDDARQAVRDGAADGYVVVAESQRAGRGSRGRTWVSPAGTDIYTSIVATLRVPPERLPPLTLVVGLAVVEALDPLLGGRAQVKWPNDVWLEGRKIVGILVEGASTGAQLEPLVIGIGINVNRREFPEGLDVPPSSLALELGHDVDRSLVLASVLNRLEVWLARFQDEGPGAAIAAINERLALRGQRARVDQLEGTVRRVAPSGALVLDTTAGERELVAGTLRAC